MKFSLPLLFLLSLFAVGGNAQGNTCYANCKQGYCLPGNALACTDCDLGLVNINNMCIGGSLQAVNPYSFSLPSPTSSLLLRDSPKPSLRSTAQSAVPPPPRRWSLSPPSVTPLHVPSPSIPCTFTRNSSSTLLSRPSVLRLLHLLFS